MMSCVHELEQVQVLSRGMIQMPSLCHALTELNEGQTVLWKTGSPTFHLMEMTQNPTVSIQGHASVSHLPKWFWFCFVVCFFLILRFNFRAGSSCKGEKHTEKTSCKVVNMYKLHPVCAGWTGQVLLAKDTAAFLNHLCSALGSQKPTDSNTALALSLSHLTVAFWSKKTDKAWPQSRGSEELAPQLALLCSDPEQTADFCFTIPSPANSRQNPRGTRVGTCLSYNAAMVLLLFKKYIFFFHEGMKFKTHQTCFSNAANGGETLA